MRQCRLLIVCLVRFVASELRCMLCVFFFFQAEDGIRDLVRSRGLGDVYKRQDLKLQEFQPDLQRYRFLRHILVMLWLEYLCLQDLSLIHI